MKKYVFEEPADIYRGIDLWMVNDKLEDDEIERQVFEFKDKGLGAAIFRTYNGLISDYPDREFMHKVRVAVEAAKKCGLKIVLQAGYMPAAVPDLPREYTLHRIFPVKEEALTGNEHVLACYEGIAYTESYAPAALNMLDKTAVDYYIAKTYDEMWSDFKDDFGKTIISVWVDEPRFENRYLTWMTNIEELFMERYGYSIGKNVLSLYHDIGDYKRVRYDYFTFIRDTMENCYYARVSEWCHNNGLMMSGHLMGEERLHMQIAQSAAIMPFYKYFDIPGIDILRCDHDWYDKPLRNYASEFNHSVNRSRDIGTIQCVSAAEQAGRKNILCEMYAVTSPNFVFRDQMHMFDFLAVSGFNCQCMHAMFYSARGFRKRFYPQSFNVDQPFWGNFRNVKDYVARVSNFVSMGKDCRDILVLHPLETAYGLNRGLSNETDESVRKSVIDYDKKFYKLITDLYSMQISFHFGDLATIEKSGSVENGKFIVGEMAYKTVAISDIEVLNSKTFELLCKFAENGGKILINGTIPSRLDGIENNKVGERLTGFESVEVFENRANFMRALRCIEKGYELLCKDDSSKIMINHRTDKEKHYFMVHNIDCRRGKHTAITLEGLHKVFRYDAENNKVQEMHSLAKDGKTFIPIEIAVGGSVLFFTEPLEEPLKQQEKANMYSVLPIDKLSCRIEDDNVFTLDLCRYKTENMVTFSEKEMDVEHVADELCKADYTGRVKLQFCFWSDFYAKNLKLVIEDLEMCTVCVNGKEVKLTDEGYYYSKAYRIVRLPDYVKPGENIIEVEKFYAPQKSAPIRDDMKHLFELFRAPRGIDLERIHILGDFVVETLPERAIGAGMVKYADRMFMSQKKELAGVSDITSHGYPFYPGVISYTTIIEADNNIIEARDVVLKIGVYNGCSASVLVNGEKIGSIDREPYSLSLKNNLKLGENHIEIKLYGTFRNMIGPSHFECGDLSGLSRDTWKFPVSYTAENEYYHKYWYPEATNSFTLVPYGIGDLYMEIYNKQ